MGDQNGFDQFVPDVVDWLGLVTDTFAGIRPVVVGEGQALKRVVERGADVAERRLDGATANWPEHEADSGPHRDQCEIQLDERPEREGGASGGVFPQAGDGVAKDLRQRHFDGDVHQQQAKAERDAARIPAKKGNNPQQIAGLEPGRLFDVNGSGHEAGIEK